VRCASTRARSFPACVPSLSAAARELLATARVAHLATSDQYARPHVVPIVFVWQEPVLYTPLDRKPKRDDDWHALRRVRNIETNGRVAVVVDRYQEDWSQLAWVMLEGIATILESGEERDSAAALLRAKYSQYETLSLEGRPIVRLEIEHSAEWSSESPSP
jgi:PPOX class probable F420-dependent enzyme